MCNKSKCKRNDRKCYNMVTSAPACMGFQKGGKLLFQDQVGRGNTSRFLWLAEWVLYCCGYCKLRVPLRVLLGYLDATVIEATVHPVAVEYPHNTPNGTPTCSSHVGTALYDTHVAGQKESGGVDILTWWSGRVPGKQKVREHRNGALGKW